LKGPIFDRLVKETGVALINGIACALILFGLNFLLDVSTRVCLTVSIALLSVIIFAAIFGTYFPLLLHRFKINPALATCPFVTTTNDIFGLFLYFTIGNMMMG